MPSLTLDQLHYKVANGGISMDEFGSLMRMGLDARGKGFAMAGPGAVFPRSNRVLDRRATIIAKSSLILIDALNDDEANALTEIFYSRKSLKIAIDFIVKFKSKTITPTCLLSLFDIDGLMRRRRKVVELARTYRADAGKDSFDPTPGNIGMLDFMYAFDKTRTRPRHWEKNSKKKQLDTRN